MTVFTEKTWQDWREKKAARFFTAFLELSESRKDSFGTTQQRLKEEFKSQAVPG